MKRVIVVSMEDTMCKQIDHIQTQLDNINIEELLEECVQYKTFRYYTNRIAEKLYPSGNDKTKASQKHGVYLWQLLPINDYLYVGKGEQMSIAKRIDCHLSNFRNNNKAESSGIKILNFIKNKGLQSIDINIKYIDLTKYSKDLIPMIERKLIDYLNPPFNREST